MTHPVAAVPAVGRCALLAALISLALAASASAATFTVTRTDDPSSGTCVAGDCSLRQAIAAVDDGDTIVLPASATPYTLTQGQLTLTKGITIQGAGAASTVIEAQDADRVMLINGNASAVRIENLKITGGATTRNGGGGLASAGPGPLVLSGVTVTGNSVTPASPTFDAARDLGGGGVFSIGPLTIANSTISNNTVTVSASGGDAGGGGVMQKTGTLTVTDSQIRNNTVTVTQNSASGLENNGGGGIYMDGTDLTIRRSTIVGNSMTARNHTITTPADGGGGIYEFGNNFELRDSVVSGNTANGPAHDGSVDKLGGGGIFDDGDTSQYLNSTITGNASNEQPADDGSDGGGGVLFDGVHGGVSIANTTIAQNASSAATGGGINSFFHNTVVNITDSIVAANTAATGGANCAGPIHSNGYNLADDTLANSCSLTGAGDVLSATTGLGALQDNGGPVATMALAAGSPAIDAGDPAGCSDGLGNTLATDARGVARPQPVAGGRCDIGAYERALPIAVTDGAAPSTTSAVLNGSAGNPDAQAGTVTFEYGPTSSYGQSTAANALPAGAGRTGFSAALSGLAAGTYHFRVVASTPTGSAAGGDNTFTVGSSAVATTTAAKKITPTSATLTGAVNPQNRATIVSFEYGLTTRYGTHTPTQTIPAGLSDVPVSAALKGLHPGRTYHFRVQALNGAGTATGSDITFHTPLRSARRLTATVHPKSDRHAPYRFRVSGRLYRPAIVAARTGCRGLVTVRATRNNKTLSSVDVALKPNCRYTIRIGIPARTAHGKVKLIARFDGNAALAAKIARAVVVRIGR